ncbi:acyltransferase [Roseivirga sp. BDSF3-8]|uniref:acyltransferase n=1 Tax=Roseivirga sp. BDSF3-8 TaxID=3241598 RepID=UPI00353180F3
MILTPDRVLILFLLYTIMDEDMQVLEKEQKKQAVSRPAIRKAEHLQYIHYLRGLAILLIVGFHCRTSYEWSSEIEQRSWFALLTQSTIIFVFIGGLLFQHLNHQHFNFKRYLGKKLKFVILPYILMSIPALANQVLFDDYKPWLPEWMEGSSPAGLIGYMLITGKHLGPFWFIPMISIFYLIAPAMLWLDKQPWFYRFVLPAILIASFFQYEFGYEAPTWESFLYYFPIYMVGMWASRYRRHILALDMKVVLPIAIFYLGITALQVFDVLAIGKNYGFYTELPDNATVVNFGKMKISIACIALLVLFYKIRKIRIPLLDFMANYSFGVYFIHLYVIRITETGLSKAGFSMPFNTLTFIAWLALITGICVAAIFTIKKITGKQSRYFIGS